MDQWYAYAAAWLPWTLDAFDFTFFLLILPPISQDFHVPLTTVTAVFTVTLRMRLGGATIAGWIGIGAEWPAGAALAMESWPARSRGLMSGLLQGSWGLGFALSSLAYVFSTCRSRRWAKATAGADC